MELYTVKMRGAKDGKHISGAENIVDKSKLEEVVSLLVKRALDHSKGSSDFINVKIEKVNDVKYINPLQVTTIDVKNKEDGFSGIKKILSDIGLNENVIDEAVCILTSIKDMRGATILDINSLKRLEEDKNRGVRVTYMDLENRNINGLVKSQKYNTHFIEAIVLASKVLSCDGIVGEICYSDDPDYTAGYVATREFGYIRFNHLKEKGNPYGGRVFLFDSSKGDLDKAVEYLENTRVIVKDNIQINKNINIKGLLEGELIEKFRR